jgi:hypothetical protein
LKPWEFFAVRDKQGALPGPDEVPDIVMKKGSKGKWRRAKLSRKHGLAIGTAMFFGFTYARDYMMQQAGYDREKYGYKYYRETETEEGTKEIAHTFSDPLALPWKYMWRVSDAFQPSADTAIARLIKAFRYEVHPFIGPLIFDLKDNITPDGKPIYSIVDDPSVKVMKSLRYLTRRYMRIIDVVAPSEATKERRKLMDQEFGLALKILLSASVFSYIRNTKDERAMHEAQAVKRRVLWEIFRSEEVLSNRQMENLETMMDSILGEDE